MTFPRRIDFTAWLQDREGICVPEAEIVIHSASWDDSGRLEGKPDVQWPARVEYSLGENVTEDKRSFVDMLCNFVHSGQMPYNLEEFKKFGPAQWLYNLISFAEQEQMEPHHYPYLRG